MGFILKDVDIYVHTKLTDIGRKKLQKVILTQQNLKLVIQKLIINTLMIITIIS
jgi:hypothetical protein